MSPTSYLVLIELFLKVNQIIINTQRTTASNYSQKIIGSLKMPKELPHRIRMRSNLWLIRYRTQKLFGLQFFPKCPPSAILVLMIFSQKLIRSSEIHIEPPHQIRVRSNPQFIKYRAHNVFGRPFFQNVLRQPSCFS